MQHKTSISAVLKGTTGKEAVKSSSCMICLIEMEDSLYQKIVIIIVLLVKHKEEPYIKESHATSTILKYLVSLHILASGSSHATFTVNMSCKLRKKKIYTSLQVVITNRVCGDFFVL